MLHVEQLAGPSAGITSCTLPLTPARQHWLATLDHDPTPLLDHLAQNPTHRLGKYYERLWHFFLQQDPDIELLAHNLPVQSKDRTIGEFDCIYFCAQRDCHVHLELAVKYFLGLQDDDVAATCDGAKRWVGPDSRDSLDAKLEQLLHRQIVLGDLPEAQPALEALGITRLAKEIALKGYLFWPQHSALPAAPAYNVECGRNDWLRRNELGAYSVALGTDSLAILPRLRWLSAAHCIDPAERIAPAMLAQRVDEHFSRKQFPLLIAALDDSGCEQSRFFVTTSSWPQAD